MKYLKLLVLFIAGIVLGIIIMNTIPLLNLKTSNSSRMKVLYNDGTYSILFDKVTNFEYFVTKSGVTQICGIDGKPLHSEEKYAK